MQAFEPSEKQLQLLNKVNSTLIKQPRLSQSGAASMRVLERLGPKVVVFPDGYVEGESDPYVPEIVPDYVGQICIVLCKALITNEGVVTFNGGPIGYEKMFIALATPELLEAERELVSISDGSTFAPPPSEAGVYWREINMLNP